MAGPQYPAAVADLAETRACMHGLVPTWPCILLLPSRGKLPAGPAAGCTELLDRAGALDPAQAGPGLPAGGGCKGPSLAWLRVYSRASSRPFSRARPFSRGGGEVCSRLPALCHRPAPAIFSPAPCGEIALPDCAPLPQPFPAHLPSFCRLLHRRRWLRGALWLSSPPLSTGHSSRCPQAPAAPPAVTRPELDPFGAARLQPHTAQWRVPRLFKQPIFRPMMTLVSAPTSLYISGP